MSTRTPTMIKPVITCFCYSLIEIFSVDGDNDSLLDQFSAMQAVPSASQLYNYVTNQIIQPSVEMSAAGYDGGHHSVYPGTKCVK